MRGTTSSYGQLTGDFGDGLKATGRPDQAAATDFNAASTLPAGLAQTLDEMSVVFRPKPRSSVADIHVECRGCAGDGLLHCFLRFRLALMLPHPPPQPPPHHRKPATLP